ncbi:MAG: PAS domain S-box protein, partial [Tabrizicola sp.]|nr:PAS domain S-box protein [Tabrizicola sp.]
MHKLVADPGDHLCGQRYPDIPFVFFHAGGHRLFCAAAQGLSLSLAAVAVRRLHHGLRKLSLAVEQSPESIAITDVDARIEYVNDAFVITTGYSREEV